MLRRHLTRGIVALWGAGLLVVGSTLMAAHWSTLPRPTLDDEQFVDELNALRGPDEGWIAVHVLYAQCGCSRRIFAHLLSSTRPEGIAEKVILVGEHEFAREAPARGFEVVAVTPRELGTRFNIESAPMFLVVDPDGAIRYAGGYTERRQGEQLEDIAIIERSLQNEATRELPLFGCGVSEQLQAILDPLGIKYAEAEP